MMQSGIGQNSGQIAEIAAISADFASISPKKPGGAGREILCRRISDRGGARNKYLYEKSQQFR
jgi:hypothetical protein